MRKLTKENFPAALIQKFVIICILPVVICDERDLWNKWNTLFLFSSKNPRFCEAYSNTCKRIYSRSNSEVIARPMAADIVLTHATSNLHSFSSSSLFKYPSHTYWLEGDICFLPTNPAVVGPGHVNEALGTSDG